VEPLPGRVGFDPQHGSSTGDGQLFPCHEAQHVSVGVAEPGQRGENATGLDAVDHGVVGGSGRAELDGSQTVVQTAASSEAAPLVSDHPVGDPVHPHQRRLAGGNLVKTAPHGQERLGDHVIDGIGRHSSAAEIPDRSVALFVELREP
jgi:hypothetical protein